MCLAMKGLARKEGRLLVLIIGKYFPNDELPSVGTGCQLVMIGVERDVLHTTRVCSDRRMKLKKCLATTIGDV